MVGGLDPAVAHAFQTKAVLAVRAGRETESGELDRESAITRIQSHFADAVQSRAAETIFRHFPPVRENERRRTGVDRQAVGMKTRDAIDAAKKHLAVPTT